MSQNKFELGELCVSPGVLEQVPSTDWIAGLRRHSQADWGVCSPYDAERNAESLKSGESLFSAYQSSQGDVYWIMTKLVYEHCLQQQTWIMLPSEYHQYYKPICN